MSLSNYSLSYNVIVLPDLVCEVDPVARTLLIPTPDRLQDGEEADETAASTSDTTSTTSKYSYTISSATVSDTGIYECVMSSTSSGTSVKSLTMPLYIRGGYFFMFCSPLQHYN